MSEEVTMGEFVEQLKEECRWYDLGVFLNVSTSELDHISRTFPHYGITKCFEELYKCIDGEKLTWNMIVESLKRMENIRLANKINLNSQMPMAKVEPIYGPVIVHKTVSGEFSKIVQAFAELDIAFKQSLDEAVKKCSLKLVDLQLYLQRLCDNIPPIGTPGVTVEELFSSIKDEYCFLNYSVLSSIAVTFKLSSEIIQMIDKYTERLENFTKTSKVIDILNEIHEANINYRIKQDCIELKLRDFWGKSTLYKFDCFVKQVLLDVYSSICSFTVRPGCICARWLFAKHNFDMQKLAPLPEDFLRAVGVISFKVNDRVIYEGPKVGCETIQASFLQAIELKNTRSIEILLATADLPQEISDTLVSSVLGITDISGYNVLYYACIFGHFEVVKLLLELKASTDFAGNNNSTTPLVIACENNQIEIAKVLICKGASANPHHSKYTPLMVACSEGLLDVVQFMLTKTSFLSTINFQSDESNGWTSLHFASSKGHSEVVSTLINAGANPELSDSEGLTPFMEACSAGHSNVVDIFLFKFPTVCGNINASTNDGRTALYFAAMNGHIEIVRKLLLAQTALNLQSSSNFSPLEIANEKGFVNIVNLILSKVLQN